MTLTHEVVTEEKQEDCQRGKDIKDKEGAEEDDCIHSVVSLLGTSS